MTEFVISLNGDHGTLLVDGEPAPLFGALVGCKIEHPIPTLDHSCFKGLPDLITSGAPSGARSGSTSARSA